MKFFIGILCMALLLSSCDSLEEPYLVEVTNFQLDELNGSTAKVTLDAEIENENFFGIKIKPSVLKVYVDDNYAGTVELTEAVKLLKKSSNVYSFPLTMKGESFVMLRLVQWMSKPQLTIRLSGKVKASVLGVSKKVEVNEK
jgi:LEA14-like dessication related protein